MATVKKPRPIERTEQVLPFPANLDAGFASLGFTHKGKRYLLTLTVRVTDDPEQATRWKRQVAWTHRSGDLRGFAEPQRVTGFLAPSDFVLVGAGSRVELTLDVERNSAGKVTPIITKITNHRRIDPTRPMRFPAELPPLTMLEAKAARLAFVAGSATAPGQYNITEFAHGQQTDVRNLSDHPWPWNSQEAIDVFLGHFDASTLNTHRATQEAQRVANLTGWSVNTVKRQRTVAIERGLLKAPKKGRPT